ncbi:DUF4145 domain-containing protein [Pantoea deleyi]|uniref:DUF4145 domain-containing protein n=1 Tax=Pantoea deleyi TaxID=470932 RepID=UPI000FE13FED|nr:DUF4145 domain-containing protein [Pantoea deleyi]
MPQSLFTWFTPQLCPGWLCPACQSASLAILPDTFMRFENAFTRLNKSEDWFEPEHYAYIFNCMLQCARSTCREVVSVSGIGADEFDYQHDEERDYTGPTYTEFFQARHFCPPLPLFLVPDACPDSVRCQLTEISSLLAAHPAAAANAIRSLLEVLLDDLKVPRAEARTNRTPRPLNLHGRLQNLKVIQAGHYDGMMALKMLGNAGSHGGKQIEQQHLDDACAVLELLINQLYQRQPDLSSQIERLNRAFAKKPVD